MVKVGCTINGTLDDSRFSEPMPWIGLYVVAASAACAIAMVLDAFHGFRYRKFWFPCKYFALNATTLTLISVAVKLAVDLNTSMPQKQDQLAKLSSTAFICTAIANSMPSLGTMENRELMMNVVALGILVVTVIVNVCIQLGTGVIYLFWFEHAVVMSLMVVLFVIFISSSFAIPATKHALDLKYKQARLWGEYIEARCLLRKEVLETLASELPKDAIRFSSKVVHIESNDCVVSVHLADGTVIKTKVLIGGDGVNSVVSKYLGLSTPSSTSRSAVRGIVHYEQGHGFEPHIMQFFGKGVRFGVVPCDDHSIYWGLTFCPSSKEKELVEDPIKLKELVLSKLGRAPEKIKQVFEKSELKNMVCAPLRFRHPWEMLWGNINTANICVVGDALHPMTPDLGQGGCSTLEESVVLARLLAKAFKQDDKDEEHRRIGKAIDEFAKGRRWRSFDLIATAYFVGFMQQSDGVVMHFLRDKLMAKFLAGLMLKRASFDCGKLLIS